MTNGFGMRPRVSWVINISVMYKDYLYKVHYAYYDDGPKWREEKFEDGRGLKEFIGNHFMMCRFIVVKRKEGRFYKEIRLAGIDNYE